MARAIALLAALAPAAIGLAAVDGAHRVGIVIATGLALAVLVALVRGGRSRVASSPSSPRSKVVPLVGAAALAIAAGLLSAEARRRHDERAARDAAPTVDLREATLPDPVPPWIELRGHFHDGFMLDEYAVEPGARPDQSQAAPAVLVPFVATTGDVARLDGPIVIARVEPARARLVGPQTIRGRTRPASPEILAVLVQVSGDTEAAPVRGVIVDTLDLGPVGALPWVHALLAVAAAIAALVLYSRVVQRPS